MKEIITYNGLKTMVDDDVYEAMKDYRFYTNQKGHVYRNRSKPKEGVGGTMMLHREIMNAPSDMQVDHRDGNTLNNQRYNLRLATRKQNQGNMRKSKTRESTSLFKGVSWDEKQNGWKAKAAKKHLGWFFTEEAAAHAYNDAAIQEWGDFANLNQVPEDPEWKAKKIPNRRDGVGKSKFIGVSWSKGMNKWQAHIMIQYKSFYLGCFDEELDAAQAYNDAVLKHRGGKGKLNQF